MILQYVLAAGAGSYITVAKQHPNADLSFVRGSYMFAAIFSAGAHCYILSYLFSLEVMFRKIFIPTFNDQVRAAGVQKLAMGAVLFLQYDFIIINISALLWCYLLVKQVKDIKMMVLVAGIIVADALIGPGALVSVVFWWRERIVRESQRLS